VSSRGITDRQIIKTIYIMKTYLKLLFTVSLFLLSYHNLNAQRYYPLKYSPDLLLGKWKAIDGNMTYEVELTFKILTDKSNDQLESILGKITYLENGRVIKKTEYNDAQSIIYGGMRLPKHAALTFFDLDRLVWWEFDFFIDDNDSNKAVWKFTKAKDDWLRMGWNEENRPDIPDGLTFHKVTGVGGPDNPVEGEILL